MVEGLYLHEGSEGKHLIHLPLLHLSLLQQIVKNIPQLCAVPVFDQLQSSHSLVYFEVEGENFVAHIQEIEQLVETAEILLECFFEQGLSIRLFLAN